MFGLFCPQTVKVIIACIWNLVPNCCLETSDNQKSTAAQRETCCAKGVNHISRQLTNFSN